MQLSVLYIITKFGETLNTITPKCNTISAIMMRSYNFALDGPKPI